MSSIKEDTNEKCKTLANTVIKLYSKISKLEKATNTVNNAPKDKPKLVKKQTAKLPSSKPNPSKTEAPATSKSKTASTQLPRPSAKAKTSPPPTTKPNVPTQSSKSNRNSKSTFNSYAKLLYVGDSVGYTASIKQ